MALRFPGRENARGRASTEPKDAAAQLAEIQRLIEADPDGFFQKTKALTDSDFNLIGKVIQIYCFSDLNARRVIDALRHAELGADARNASRLQDAQVFPKLREAAAKLQDGNLKEGLLLAANTIELHREHRHNFAHWAARRVAGYDALIIYSKNAREAERRDGIAQDPDELKYGLIPLGPLREELVKLEGHGKYLAEQAAFVEASVDRFREYFAGT